MVSNRFEHFIRFLIYEFIMQEFVINRSLGVHVEEKGRGVAFWCSFYVYTYYSWCISVEFCAYPGWGRVTDLACLAYLFNEWSFYFHSLINGYYLHRECFVALYPVCSFLMCWYEQCGCARVMFVMSTILLLIPVRHHINESKGNVAHVTNSN